MAILQTSTENGEVAGLPAGNQGISIFKGIPYAKPPVGNLRWKAPQPAENWEGIYNAYSFSDIPMQCRVPETSMYKKEFYPVDLPRSEDSLYLNIWTPAKSQDEKLPVALWIYGGGFVQGYSDKMETDGDAFAKRGVIYVSINYRLNVFGFLSHPELSAESEKETGIRTSGNYGTLDQIAALKWVRRNIEAFGGDPDNITIFGQSAGAMSVQTLLSSKLTDGDIDKAIMQSAAGLGRMQEISRLELSDAEKHGEEFLETLNVKNIEEARKIPAEDLINHFAKALSPEGLQYMPVIDGYVLEADLITLAKQNKTHNVPTMIGCTSDDLTFSEDKKNDIHIGCTAWSRLHNRLGHKPVYQYYFNHAIPDSDIGTFHSSEHMYVFQTFLRGWRSYSGADFDLSNRMCAYWTNFIKTGNPNAAGMPEWKAYTNKEPNVIELFNEKKSRELPPAEQTIAEADSYIK